MSRYKGYKISTTTVQSQTRKVTEVVYRLDKGATVIQSTVVPGPFDSDEDARAAAEWAARGWIDLKEKESRPGGLVSGRRSFD